MSAKARSPLSFFLALDPKVDIPHVVEHEHFSIVALRAHQKIAEVLDLILAVRDNRVFARPRHIDVEPAARLEPLEFVSPQYIFYANSSNAASRASSRDPALSDA